MANEYYDHTTYPSNGAHGSSSAMRSELNTIEAGFDKLPTMAGNGGEIVAVNAGGTALEAIATTGTGSGVRAISCALTTPQINDTSADHQYIFAVNELAADRTVTLPLLTGNDEFVFKDHAVTLAYKTLTAPVINGIVTTTGLTMPAFTLSGNVGSTGNPSLNIGTGALTAGAAMFSGNLTVGGSDANHYMYLYGADSGTDGGSAVLIGNAIATIIGIGNKSAMLGGAYDATPMIYANATISIYQGISVNGPISSNQNLVLSEMTAPSGAANKVGIFAEDNGAGKTRLMAIFGTGAAQQISIEP